MKVGEVDVVLLASKIPVLMRPIRYPFARERGTELACSRGPLASLNRRDGSRPFSAGAQQTINGVLRTRSYPLPTEAIWEAAISDVILSMNLTKSGQPLV